MANGLVRVSSVKRRKIGGKFEIRGRILVSVNTSLCYCLPIYGEKINRTFLFLQPHVLQHTRYFLTPRRQTTLPVPKMTCLLGKIALSLGLCSLFVCLVSLLLLGFAAPLGLMEINVREEIEDFSTYIDEMLVALPGRAWRYVCSLIISALLNTVQISRHQLPTNRATCRSGYQSDSQATPDHRHLACTVHLHKRDEPTLSFGPPTNQSIQAFTHRKLGGVQQELASPSL